MKHWSARRSATVDLPAAFGNRRDACWHSKRRRLLRERRRVKVPPPLPHESRSSRASSGNSAKRSAWQRSLARNAHEHDCCRRDERHLGGRNQCCAGAVRFGQGRTGQWLAPTQRPPLSTQTSNFLVTRSTRSLLRFGAQFWQ